MTTEILIARAREIETAISYVCTETEENRAVRKLAEERATQEVRRAVNTWIYSQEEG